MGILNIFRKKEEKREGVTLEELFKKEGIDIFSDSYRNLAGVTVNEKKAMTYMAFWACVRVISETIATLPLKTYKNSNEKEIAKEHPAYYILKTRPNEKMSSYTLKQITGYHITTWGNAYWYLVFGNDMKLKEIIPLLPDRTTPVVTSKGEIIYKTIIDNETRWFDSTQIAHFKGPSFDGLVGMSTVQMMKETLGLGIAANEYGSRFFSQGTHLGGVLETANKLSDEAYERLKKSIATDGGLLNSHKIKILEEGLSFKKLGLPPGDSQFLETRKFQTGEIARFFRIPPHKIGDLDKTSYNSIESQGIEFLTDTIAPYLTMIEQEVNYKVFRYDEAGKYYAEHDVNAILRGDTKGRYDAYAVGRQWGWLSANDVRKLENMTPVDGGEIYYIPLNMVPSTMANKITSKELENKRNLYYLEEFNVAKVDEKRHSKVQVRSANKRFLLTNNYNKKFSNVIEEFTKIEVEEFKRQIKKHIDTRSHVDDLFKEIKDFYDSKRSEIDSNYRKIMNEYLEELRNILEDELNQNISLKELQDDIDKYINAYVNRHITTNMDGLNEVIKAQSELSDKDYDKSLDELGQRSVNMESKEESVRASNYFAMLVYATQKRKARWVTTGSSSCPICKRMDGRVVSAGKPFLRKNDQIKDGDLVFSSSYEKKHPPLHTGCDCVIMAD